MINKTKKEEKYALILILSLLILTLQVSSTTYNYSSELSVSANNAVRDDYPNHKIVCPSRIHDSNGDKIADTLSKLISGQKMTVSQEALQANGKKVEVMICVNKKPDLALIEKFKSMGAEIVKVYDKLIYGIAAILPVDKISIVAAEPTVTLIENKAYSKAHLDSSTVNMGVRGSQYVWDSNPVINGNPYYSIAILDTGVDSSHSDMQNFLYFRDFTTHGYPNGSNGIDYGHHGTHCASIAAGTGNADKDPNTTNQTIAYHFHSNVGWFYTTHWFEVKDNSNQPNTSITLDWDTSGGGSAGFGIRDSLGMSVSPTGSYSNSPISYNLNLTAGWYQVVVYPEVATTSNKDYTITIEHESKYMLSTDPVSSPVYAGVAPESKIISLKVLNDTRIGDSIWFQNALSWISTNGKDPAYNITVISMSLGFDNIYSSIDTAINNLVDEGFICVSSAGNDGTNFGENAINSPGTAQKCITVGAVNDAFEVTSYSSNGNSTFNKPDVVAPGGTLAFLGSSSLHNLIIAADSNYGEDGNSMLDIVTNDYVGMWGTSMSCAHVAGLIQLLIDAIVRNGGNWIWSQENALRVKQIICMGTWETNSGETFDGDGDGIPQNPTLNRVGKDLVEGYGMVRADAVIQSITNATTGPFTNVSYYLNRRAGEYAKDHKVLLYSFEANVGTTYEFTLNVPSTGDFDLIIYNHDYDPNSGNPIINISSINSGLDIDESVTFIPTENGTYYWSIRAVQGNGTCEISMSQSTTNYAPYYLANPTPLHGAIDVDLPPILSVRVSDVDGDLMNVSFYDASDDSLIEIDTNVPNGGIASIIWFGLSEGTTYDWYVVASDGFLSNVSSTWTFTVFNDNPTWVQIPTDQIIEYGHSFNYDLNAVDTSGIAIYWINDTSHFNIDGNGLITNITALAVGTYWLEVRAYDPYSNYCNENIKIIIQPESTETGPPPIPGYNLVFLVFIIAVVVHWIIKKKKESN